MAPLLFKCAKTLWIEGEQAQAAVKAHILYQVCQGGVPGSRYFSIFHIAFQVFFDIIRKRYFCADSAVDSSTGTGKDY